MGRLETGQPTIVTQRAVMFKTPAGAGEGIWGLRQKAVRNNPTWPYEGLLFSENAYQFSPRGKIMGQGYFLKRHTPASKQTFPGARAVRAENRVSRRFIPARDLRISPCEKAESDKKECSRDRQSDISSYHASPSGK